MTNTFINRMITSAAAIMLACGSMQAQSMISKNQIKLNNDLMTP